jgi:hypothetical protein
VLLLSLLPIYVLLMMVLYGTILLICNRPVETLDVLIRPGHTLIHHTHFPLVLPVSIRPGHVLHILILPAHVLPRLSLSVTVLSISIRSGHALVVLILLGTVLLISMRPVRVMWVAFMVKVIVISWLSNLLSRLIIMNGMESSTNVEVHHIAWIEKLIKKSICV